ncbi:hypothetical protein BDV97DRAFT_201728 [Delphinella strobiligena]|nr:hypothetical protein BDV97DRAFT_201728 [Delphinella strobiligena]
MPSPVDSLRWLFLVLCFDSFVPYIPGRLDLLRDSTPEAITSRVPSLRIRIVKNDSSYLTYQVSVLSITKQSFTCLFGRYVFCVY